MRMEGGYKKPLARQIREGVETGMSGTVLINSKSEWNGSRIPRIVIEAGEEQIEVRDSGLGNKGEQEKRERRLGANYEKIKDRVRNRKRRGGEEVTCGWRDKRLKFDNSEIVNESRQKTSKERRVQENEKAQVRKEEQTVEGGARDQVGCN